MRANVKSMHDPLSVRFHDLKHAIAIAAVDRHTKRLPIADLVGDRDKQLNVLSAKNDQSAFSILHWIDMG
jgi:hypothetical protein